MKKLLIVGFVFILSAGVFAQSVPQGLDLANYGVRIEPDKRVMTVLATLEAARTTNAAGENVPVIKTPLSAEGEKFRELLTSDLAALNDELRQRISTFVLQYKKRYPNASEAELVTPFISMAYALTPAPDLADPVVTGDLPGNLLDVLDFSPLVRDFYRRSSFSANIGEYVKLYQRAADGQLRSSAREMVNELLNYLHTRPHLTFTERIQTQTQKGKSKSATLKKVEIRERERRFFIVPEMLAPAGSVHFLNVKDDYFAIVPPQTDLSGSSVRRAYLQFVIDPLVINNSKDIATIRESVKKILEERRKVDATISPDIYLTISRSLVAAVEARQTEHALVSHATARARQQIEKAKTTQEKLAISQELQKYVQSRADETALQLSESYEKGSVLSFYFAEQLKGVEDSGFDIASSIREMILSFDSAKEVGRLDQFSAARKRALAARSERKNNPGIAAVAENPVTARLLEIQATIAAKDYEKAYSGLKVLASANPSEPRVFYNLGRVASLSAESLTDSDQQSVKLLEAKQAYENVVKIAQKQQVDPALLSLTFVALAKIYEFFDDKTYAIGIYDRAIRLGPVAGGAHDEAVAAKQRLIKEQ